MFTIDELPIPATLDAEGGAAFSRAIEVGNLVQAITYGTSDIAYEPAEELPHFTDPFTPHRMLLARVDGEIVGRAQYETRTGEQSDAAWITVEVLPEFRGQGIGTALAERVEQIARSDGKAKALAYMGMQDEPGERLPSPTGFGSVPVASGDVQFLLTRGYSFEQVERISRLPLPVENLDALVDEAIEASGPEYALHYWVGSTPERWHEDLALLGTRMSTDAPTAGLEEPEDIWTVDRIIAADERDRTSPRTRAVAAVEHVPSGHLVGYTVLSLPAQGARCVDQYATLVLREHRGHRLGMLLKVANLQHLQRVAPGHPSVITFNAEENRHMLSVNEKVGFTPIGYEGAWRKDL